MNKMYFENALRNSGLWRIYEWQTLTKDPEEFYDNMMRRPLLDETRSALENLIGEREKVRAFARKLEE